MDIVLDFETCNPYCDVTVVGSTVYAEHWATEILCCYYNDHLWLPVDQNQWSYLDQYVRDPSVMFIAHNTGFEKDIWREIAFLHLRHAAPGAPASRRCSTDMRTSGIGFNDLDTTQSSLEDIFVDLAQERRELNLHAVKAIVVFRNVARLSARSCRAYFRRCCRLRCISSCSAPPSARAFRRSRRQLRRLHRARADHVVAPDPEHRQRLVRHLFPALHRHHLRVAVGADLGVSRSCSATWARRRRSRLSSA